ncbi:MAG: ABC transporter ATP-binding protein [Caulobacterales bacterium 32-69-10]|nr:MAG: ABC transporter ATP-binding protein [Caulobacterales bacterium 32-69-10]
MAAATTVGMRDFLRWAAVILGPDRGFFGLAIVYGLGVGLLSLATPISVQMLINSVANTALPAPLFTLAAVLFAMLALQGVLNGLRLYVMELFRRRFFARLMAEATLRAVHARNPFFQDERRGDLFNRFFDVMTVQKAMPSLLIGFFALVLQSAVGFVVTSFYHPVFLAFNLIVVLAVWLIWRVWSRGAMRTAVAQSHAKYAAAAWLESIGASNGFYKSGRHLSFAMQRSEALTARYVEEHGRHFRSSFAQAAGFMALYAVASASLLAMGGWLVIRGQLSLGQLVAAELILSSIFFGIAQLGTYLDVFYDLVAAVEELNQLYDIPQEAHPPALRPPAPMERSDLVLRDVRIGESRFDLTLPAGARLAASAEPGTERHFTRLLRRHLKPDAGLVILGGTDLAALDVYQLRTEVVILDRPVIVEGRLRDYLTLAAPEAPAGAVLDVLDRTGLGRTVARLPEGLDTVVASTGWPLSPPEMMRLRLAAALLSQPRVLVLSPLFDVIPGEALAKALAALGPRSTAVCFTNRPAELPVGAWLHLGKRRQVIVDTPAELDRLAAEDREHDHAVSA